MKNKYGIKELNLKVNMKVVLLLCFLLFFFIKDCSVFRREPGGGKNETVSHSTNKNSINKTILTEKKGEKQKRTFVIEEWKETTPEERKKPDKKGKNSEIPIFSLNPSPESTPSQIKTGNEEDLWKKNLQSQLQEARAGKKKHSGDIKKLK